MHRSIFFPRTFFLFVGHISMEGDCVFMFFLAHEVVFIVEFDVALWLM